MRREKDYHSLEEKANDPEYWKHRMEINLSGIEFYSRQLANYLVDYEFSVKAYIQTIKKTT